jgi:hypothetical protein
MIVHKPHYFSPKNHDDDCMLAQNQPPARPRCGNRGDYAQTAVGIIKKSYKNA